MIPFKVTYKDRFGEEETIGYTDGSDLHVTLRNQLFTGSSFNMLEAVPPFLHPERFTTYHNDLIDCVFYTELPVWIIPKDSTSLKKAILKGSFDYKDKKNQLDIILEYGESSFPASAGYMENILNQLQKQLPEGNKLTCCLSCRYSNYNPYGQNDMGTLYCFKRIKERVQQIQDKYILLDIWEEATKESKIFSIQEFFICNDFQSIRPADWCYKSW